MTHDIVIRGGHIVDGTGREPVRGDLAIDGGIIAAVGKVDGGAPRFIQRSIGYKATIVNGQVNVLDGEHTGVRAGAVLRHAR